MLSKFMDGELGEIDRIEMTSHIEDCRECKQELSELLTQRELLSARRSIIKPSTGFHAIFWQKARALENSGQTYSFPVLRWASVPIGISFFLILFTAFSFISPALYGGNISEAAKRSFIGYSTQSVFAPVNYAKFCDKCINSLCECCKAKPGAKCACVK